ncbi:hypothetical protein PR048_007048 [Dryococelus australis]|uniref:Uncharacterized protein n=1 Tax=Dryococelus australis TaxID=614101 RepID=A0ABQ9ID44_9NEOP|nr:hypothetical protein PR048_007048 [Dryococelus australis]
MLHLPRFPHEKIPATYLSGIYPDSPWWEANSLVYYTTGRDQLLTSYRHTKKQDLQLRHPKKSFRKLHEKTLNKLNFILLSVVFWLVSDAWLVEDTPTTMESGTKPRAAYCSINPRRYLMRAGHRNGVCRQPVARRRRTSNSYHLKTAFRCRRLETCAQQPSATYTGNNSKKLQRVWRRTGRGTQSMLVRYVREWNVLREELVSEGGFVKFRKGVEEELVGTCALVIDLIAVHASFTQRSSTVNPNLMTLKADNIDCGLYGFIPSHFCPPEALYGLRLVDSAVLGNGTSSLGKQGNGPLARDVTNKELTRNEVCSSTESRFQDTADVKTTDINRKCPPRFKTVESRPPFSSGEDWFSPRQVVGGCVTTSRNTTLPREVSGAALMTLYQRNHGQGVKRGWQRSLTSPLPNLEDLVWSGARIVEASPKSKYRNRTRLERASQKQSSDTHETPYDLVKRCREYKINIKASERVNVDVFTQNKRPCPQHKLFSRDLEVLKTDGRTDRQIVSLYSRMHASELNLLPVEWDLTVSTPVPPPLFFSLLSYRIKQQLRRRKLHSELQQRWHAHIKSHAKISRAKQITHGTQSKTTNTINRFVQNYGKNLLKIGRALHPDFVRDLPCGKYSRARFNTRVPSYEFNMYLAEVFKCLVQHEARYTETYVPTYLYVNKHNMLLAARTFGATTFELSMWIRLESQTSQEGVYQVSRRAFGKIYKGLSACSLYRENPILDTRPVTVTRREDALPRYNKSADVAKGNPADRTVCVSRRYTQYESAFHCTTCRVTVARNFMCVLRKAESKPN